MEATSAQWAGINKPRSWVVRTASVASTMIAIVTSPAMAGDEERSQ